jgi:hypothetical protein
MAGGAHARPKAVRGALRLLTEQREEQLGLAREVPVEGAGREAGLGEDVVDPQTLVSVVFEQAPGRLPNQLLF